MNREWGSRMSAGEGAGRTALWVAIGVCVCALLTGCKSNEGRPDKPELMSDGSGTSSLVRYSLAEYTADKRLYDAAIANARTASDSAEMRRQLELARLSRDVMINRVRSDIRDHSGEFEDALRQRIAAMATGADFVELGLSAATTIVGGESAKTVLAAILTAVKGGRISVDKNFFRERTSEAIVAALRTSRLTQDTAIVKKMSLLDVRQYTFEEAWNDLVDLYYAGTLASAFQTLSEQAGARAEAAKQEQVALDNVRVEITAATPQEIADMGRLYGALKDMTADQASAILSELGVQVLSGADPVRALQAELRKLPPGDARTEEFIKAYDKTLGPGAW